LAYRRFNEYFSMNILFTCVGRRNYLLNYFRESLSKEDSLFAIDMDATAPGMADADVAIIAPSIYDSNYISFLLEIVKKHAINAIISLNDLEAPILSKARKQIEEQNCMLIVSDDSVIDITFDKKKTAAFINEIGLNSPLTYTKVKDFWKAHEKGLIDFPIVIKPRWGSASIGIEFPETEEEFILMDKLSRIKLKRTILSKVSSQDINEAILYQEKISGTEYGLDVLNDFNGNYIGTFARKKLGMRAGETDKAESVIITELEHIGKTISQHLKHIGNLDCDVLVQDGKYYVLEMNSRFGGGYPFSHEAGAHGTACYISWLKGETDVSKHLNYRPGEIYSKHDHLISVNRGNHYDK
jgi:carbamoyl-phosphate synthase large subunit